MPTPRIPGRRVPGKLTGTNCTRCDLPQTWKTDARGVNGCTPQCLYCIRERKRERHAQNLNDNGIEYVPRNTPLTEPIVGEWTGTYCPMCDTPKIWINPPHGWKGICPTCKIIYAKEWRRTENGKALTKKNNDERAEVERRDPKLRKKNSERVCAYGRTPRGKRNAKKRRGKHRAARMKQACPCCAGWHYGERPLNIYPNARCIGCGGLPDTWDHLYPLRLCEQLPSKRHPNLPQGAHCNTNLIPVCNSCNSSKQDRVYPDHPNWESWISERHLWRRRELRRKKAMKRKKGKR